MGLKGEARRIVLGLLEEYSGWDASGLATLHAYGLSCARLEAFQTAAEAGRDLYRELRANIALLRELNLERAK